MKIEDMRKQSIQELTQQLVKYEDDLANFMLEVYTQEVSDNRRGRRIRKDIARIKTIIREKELE